MGSPLGQEETRPVWQEVKLLRQKCSTATVRVSKTENLSATMEAQFGKPSLFLWINKDIDSGNRLKSVSRSELPPV